MVLSNRIFDQDHVNMEIQAAKVLEAEGFQCNLTLLFGFIRLRNLRASKSR